LVGLNSKEALMSRVETVLASLREGGAVITPGTAEHQYIVTSVGELTLEPPVILTIDPAVLERLLEKIGESARTVFPEVPAMEAARRLVSIDIEECLITGKKALSITVTPDEVKVIRSDEWRNPPPDLAGHDPRDLYWTTTPPDPGDVGEFPDQT
jgi:hypothetical protein